MQPQPPTPSELPPEAPGKLPAWVNWILRPRFSENTRLVTLSLLAGVLTGLAGWLATGRSPKASLSRGLHDLVRCPQQLGPTTRTQDRPIRGRPAVLTRSAPATSRHNRRPRARRAHRWRLAPSSMMSCHASPASSCRKPTSPMSKAPSSTERQSGMASCQPGRSPTSGNWTPSWSP